jgi:hypothetical protein
MSASSLGSLVLIVVGVAFLTAAALVFRRARSDPGARWGLAIDVLVGLVALADGVTSTLQSPDQLVVWSVGTAALVAAAVLLLVHQRGRHSSV